MSSANLDITTFANKPKEGLEVVDIFDAEAIGAFTADPTSIKNLQNLQKQAAQAGDLSALEKLTGGRGLDIISEVYPDLKADKIVQSIQDTGVQDYLRDANQTYNDLVKSARNALPPSLNLKDLMDDYDLPLIKDTMNGLKGLANPSEWKAIDQIYGSDVLGKYKDLTKKFNIPGCSFCDTKCATTQRQTSTDTDPLGLQNTYDTILNASKIYADSKRLLTCGLANKALEFINSKTGILDSNILEDISSSLAVIAAGQQEYDRFKDFMAKANKRFGKREVRESLIATMQNYKIPTDTPLARYPAEATKIIARLDAIDVDWMWANWGTDRIANTRYFRYASSDLLDVLIYANSSSSAAATYLALRPSNRQIKVIAREQYPGLVFT